MNVDDVIQEFRKLRSLDQFQEAIELLTRAIENNVDARLYYFRGTMHELLDEPNKAVENYSEAIKLDPNNPKYYWERGCVFSFLLKKNTEAIEDFENTIRLESSHFEAYQQCCLCLLLLKKPDEAIKHAKAAQHLAPDNALTHFCLGQSYINLNRIDEAAESFFVATGLEPNQSHYWSGFGDALAKTGNDLDIPASIHAYSMAIQIDPDTPMYYVRRGQLFLRLEMGDKAKQDLSYALNLCSDPNESMIINHYLRKISEQVEPQV